MWSNVLKPGETHRPHTHSNNILSGVFYVDQMIKHLVLYLQTLDHKHVLFNQM